MAAVGHPSFGIKLPAGDFFPHQQGLESYTVLKCTFCILCQLRYTSEKPRDEPFQNCNRIGHARDPLMDI
jgi:hypothetical protein